MSRKAKKKTPYTNKQKECIEICNRRHDANMTCYYCKFENTDICGSIKSGYKVQKPWQINNIIERW